MKVIYNRRSTHLHTDNYEPMRPMEKLWAAIAIVLFVIAVVIPEAHAAVGDPKEIDLPTFLLGCGLVGLGVWLFNRRG